VISSSVSTDPVKYGTILFILLSSLAMSSYPILFIYIILNDLGDRLQRIVYKEKTENYYLLGSIIQNLDI